MSSPGPLGNPGRQWRRPQRTQAPASRNPPSRCSGQRGEQGRPEEHAGFILAFLRGSALGSPRIRAGREQEPDSALNGPKRMGGLGRRGRCRVAALDPPRILFLHARNCRVLPPPGPPASRTNYACRTQQPATAVPLPEGDESGSPAGIPP